MIEQRKARRFDLKLPFELVRSGSFRTSHTGETKNLSSVGVLLAADGRFEVGDPIEYLISIPTPPEVDRVRIRCLGKVVRLGEAEVAATLERYEFLRNGRHD